MNASYELDFPILKMEGQPGFTLRNAVEGVQVFGGIGSGKTTGSGATLALKYLKAGYGGLVLTVKKSEVDHWKKYCQATNRLDDLIIVSPENPYCFNFINYEAMAPKELGGGLTDNIANLFKTLITVDELSKGKMGDDPFWENALNMLLYNTIDLCLLAHKKVTIDDLNSIVSTIPTNSRAFENRSFLENTPFGIAWLRTKDIQNEDLQRHINNVTSYFETNHADLHHETRSIIDYSFMGLMLLLTRDPIYSLFCSPKWDRINNPSCSIAPENCRNGKIILIDLPVNLYQKVGRDGQILFKYIWQRTMLRGSAKKETRPVFLWADEAQHFIHEMDIDYQAVAREQKICTVYLSQNISNYFNKLGGERGKYLVYSFLGTIGTKIFHANSDIETNNYASALIGKEYKKKVSKSEQISPRVSRSKSTDIIKDSSVEPEEFARLKTGGKPNDYIVEAYAHKQGMPWPGTTGNYLKMEFEQYLSEEISIKP